MKTILLIDDSLMLRMTFGKALREVGYNVIEADSGVVGLALARQHLPDLILSDIQMPGGDGTTLLREIRRDPVLRARQLVLMTGRPDIVTPRKGMEDGADDFLVKPVNLDDLLRCVEARLKRASISWRVEDDRLAQLRSLVPPQLPHELFTPMAGIIGLTEILRSDISELTSGEVSDILNDLHQSELRLHRTLRNYLLILDLQNAGHETLLGSLSPRQVEESIRAGIKEVLQLNNREEDITVQVDPCSIAVKPEDLHRMVEELVDNACKFSRQGTPVKVELSSNGRLTISDHGRGLTKEDIMPLDFAGPAWELYLKWKTHQGFAGTGLRSLERDGYNIVEVPDGIIFPILASLAQFVVKTPAGWKLQVPSQLTDVELIAAAKPRIRKVGAVVLRSWGRPRRVTHRWNRSPRSIKSCLQPSCKAVASGRKARGERSDAAYMLFVSSWRFC